MKWVSQDLKKYLEAKEYIDTLMLPLIPLQISKTENVVKNANENETSLVIVNEIEKELSGRVMLLPAYYYLQATNKENEVDRLHQVVEEITQQPFQYYFFITPDLKWKRYEKHLDSELLLIPSMQAVDMHSKEGTALIQEQVSQFSELIRSYW